MVWWNGVGTFMMVCGGRYGGDRGTSGQFLLGDLEASASQWDIGACIVITFGIFIPVFSVLCVAAGASMGRSVVCLTRILTLRLNMRAGMLVLVVITIGLLFLVSDMLSLVVGAMARQVVVRLTCICTTHLRMYFGLSVLVL